MTIKLGDQQSGAVFSDCTKYRYSLWRRWNLLLPECRMVAFIGLNPSTADHSVNDPTVTRCINYAKSWGFDGMYMLNLFAYRATDPRDMKKHRDPVGEENNKYICEVVDSAAITVCAWGTHGRHLDRAPYLLSGLTEWAATKLHALRLTKDGYPSHPLYLPANLQPRRWLVKDGLLANNLPFGA